MHKLRIERSNPDEQVCYDPDLKQGYTRLQEYAKNYYHRKDIFMVLVDDIQHWAYPAPYGIKGDTNLVFSFMSPDDIAWCLEETAKLIRLCEIHPEYQKVFQLVQAP